jgi:hypothetical protein
LFFSKSKALSNFLLAKCPVRIDHRHSIAHRLEQWGRTYTIPLPPSIHRGPKKPISLSRIIPDAGPLPERLDFLCCRFFNRAPTTLNDRLATATETFLGESPEKLGAIAKSNVKVVEPETFRLFAVLTLASSLSFSCFRLVLSVSSLSSLVLRASSSSWNT